MNPATIDREEFEYWLASIDDFLDEFMAQFPPDDRSHLDYSPESLDLVEQWILQNYSDTDAMLATSESHRVNLAACYVGETFRKSCGGMWSIRFDDPKFVYHGLPIIVASGHASECPLTLVTASADRRTGTYIQTVLENF